MDMRSKLSLFFTERSFFSKTFNEKIDVADWDLSMTLRHCQSRESPVRKVALLHLRTILKSRRFEKAEVKAICDAFRPLFEHPDNQTFCIFLDILIDFVSAYRDQLHDWLYYLLVRLLSNQHSRPLVSTRAKAMETMAVVHASFPCHLQFCTLINYIIDPANMPSLMMKAEVLKYLEKVTCGVDQSRLHDQSELIDRAASKMKAWAEKSLEIRRYVRSILGILDLSLSIPSTTGIEQKSCTFDVNSATAVTSTPTKRYYYVDDSDPEIVLNFERNRWSMADMPSTPGEIGDGDS